jgi:hypothetical protein
MICILLKLVNAYVIKANAINNSHKGTKILKTKELSPHTLLKCKYT